MYLNLINDFVDKVTSRRFWND